MVRHPAARRPAVARRQRPDELATRALGQLHFELVASEKLLTEFTTLAAAGASAAIWPTEGLEGSALTALESASTEDVIALVSVGKSLLAELTTLLASDWIFWSCDCRPLSPPMLERFVSPLIDAERSLRCVQYAGLLDPHPPSAITPITPIAAKHAARGRIRDEFMRGIASRTS